MSNMSTNKNNGATRPKIQARNASTESNTEELLRPPAITVSKVLDIDHFFRTVMRAIHPSKCRKEDVNKLCAEDTIAFKKVIKYLLGKRVDYDIFQTGYEPMVAVVRNIPPDTPTQDIKEELTEYGFKVRKVLNAVHPRYRIRMPLFFVYLEPEEKSQEIFKIKKLAYTVVKVEAFQTKSGSPYGYNKIASKEIEKTDTTKSDEKHKATSNKTKSCDESKQGINNKVSNTNDIKTTNCQNKTSNNENTEGIELAKGTDVKNSITASTGKPIQQLPLPIQNVDINLTKSPTKTKHEEVPENVKTEKTIKPLMERKIPTPVNYEKNKSLNHVNPWTFNRYTTLDFNEELYNSIEDIINTPDVLRDMAFWPTLVENVNDIRSSTTKMIHKNCKEKRWGAGLTYGHQTLFNNNNIGDGEHIFNMRISSTKTYTLFNNESFDLGHSLRIGMLSSSYSSTKEFRITDFNYLPMYQMSNNSKTTPDPTMDNEINYRRETIQNLYKKSINSSKEIRMPTDKQGTESTINESDDLLKKQEECVRDNLKKPKMEEVNPLLSIDLTFKDFRRLYGELYETDYGESLKHFVMGWYHAYSATKI